MADRVVPNPDSASGQRFQINPPVFFVSAGLIVAFAIFGSVFAKQAGAFFTQLQAAIVRDLGWFYVLAVAGFLLFVLFLLFSRYGDVKLGPDEIEPEYSYSSWFAMLFSAGMGIGLLFFGVAEPIQHYVSPPIGDGGTVAAAREAMVLTFFHWGLHAWAIYIIVALALAYFAYRRGLPLAVRSALFPLIGRKIYGPIGHAIDIFAVIGTMFGVATSLGLGVLQVNAGFAYLFGFPVGTLTQLLLIAVITGLATVSVVLGLDRGIKRLSELNIALAIFLLLFVLVAGPTIFLLQAYVQNIGAYLGAVVPRTFRMYAYDPNPWLGDWTLFYWGWWIAWSPFVGMFIARISKGRTIREFVMGVLLVPVLFTFLWMTVFGNSAIALDMAGTAPIAQIVEDDMPVALFAMLEQLPLATITAGAATLLVITFFVTSADSGALVIDTITSGGSDSSHVWQRIFWAVAAGAIAAVLLLAGGLQALQTAAIASALPFAVIMVFICFGLLRALQREGSPSAEELSAMLAAPAGDRSVRWQQRLASIVQFHRRAEALDFLNGVARPALEEVKGQIDQRGLSAELKLFEERLDLIISHGEQGSFCYIVRVRGYRAPSFAWAESGRAEEEERHFRVLAQSSEGDQPHDITGFTRDQLINDFLTRYAHFRQARRMA